MNRTPADTAGRQALPKASSPSTSDKEPAGLARRERSHVVAFHELQTTDLQVDAIYRGGRGGHAGDDPLCRLLGVSNSGGFRYRGSLEALEILVLTTTLDDPDWPDALDADTGVFTYYGDNKKPGRALHDTPRYGNALLKTIFADAHGSPSQRMRVPPILVFANTGQWRDVSFLGIAVPGTIDLRPSEDLVAIWKTANGSRFQNYRARFTILDVPAISRAWISDIVEGRPDSDNAPARWQEWRTSGRYRPLMAVRSVEYRTKSEQLPKTAERAALVSALRQHFASRPHDFERCAGVISRFLLSDITALDLTRPSRDGGRDGIGQLRIGQGSASISVDFALEAKCYSVTHGVGVRDMSRLISRLRHRQFGILVTTSYVDMQAYKEIRDDKHPIIVVAANDIADLLTVNGYSDPKQLRIWLDREFPE